MQNQKQTLKQRYNTTVNRVAAVVVPVAFAAAAHAELDMGAAETQIGFGLAAIGAIGAVKLGPSALSWVWSLVTSQAKRG